MKKNGDYVVVTKAEKLDYMRDYVALPKDYGTPAYFERRDVQTIKETVFRNLKTLDRQTGFTDRMKGRKVIIKPNLVILFHRIGFVDKEYPQSTDPRVLDAVVAFVKQYTGNIVIAESAGRGAPTRTVFKIAGIDRLARYHGAGLAALEEMPVHRYILPKAQVMKEILVPELFSELVEGNAFYISVPKMKTNLYTGVTLGFKNAMGIIPYNLRQRNHNHALDRKLVDMLYLLKPGLTVIDGIVGAEGNCPAPVFPVDSRFIISGTGSVATDYEAARLMGFDPNEIAYIKIAKERGFAGTDVRVIREEEPVSFRKADPSLTGDHFAGEYPDVRVLVGRELKDFHPGSLHHIDKERIKQMEMYCRGGCLSTLRFAFDMIKYEGLDMSFVLNVILGPGVLIEGKKTWFDREGNAYTTGDIPALSGPKLAVGNCTADLAGLVDIHLSGCMPFPNAPHAAIHKLIGKRCKIMTLKNRHLFSLLIGTLEMRAARRRQIKKGRYFDCDFPFEDKILEPRHLTEAEKKLDYIRQDLPPMTPGIKKQLLRAERKEFLDTFK